MEIVETFGKAVNISFKGVEASLKFLDLTSTKLEKMIKGRRFLVVNKNFDIVIDYKPKLNQIILYLAPKKWSKKLMKKLDPKTMDFKSMVIFIGRLHILEKDFELRLGAFGIPSSDLVKAINEFKK